MKSVADLPYRPCAGVMLINPAVQVFVGQRLDSSADAWQMPQGGIDPGESAEDAAIRELGEETGIAPHLVDIVARSASEHLYDLPPHLMGKMWGGRYRGQRQTWFLMRFRGTDDDVNIATKHQEFRAWRWVGPDQLESLIVPFKKELYRNVVAEFAPHF
ncbi:RNA pyrophosphohydrolase [Aquisediminimonas profunda]|uniref:RNA pyrophosphohydrolase n=1 Tax=Aquisediminimonas profunda TaxID=1550733 RepID=UPI001C62BBDC|nr:RNA pyrophosphohydrolase [Aquisediminimonas profunda]